MKKRKSNSLKNKLHAIPNVLCDIFQEVDKTKLALGGLSIITGLVGRKFPTIDTARKVVFRNHYKNK